MQGRDAVADEHGQPNRVQVVVRVRPVLPHELSDEVAVTCSPDARRLQVLLPERLSGGAAPLPGAARGAARSYEFDACLAGNTTQEELFDVCGMQELVEAALDGYCVTIFAFGQTGSGKTHTIIGPRLSRGAGAAAGANPGAPAGASSDAGGPAGDRGSGAGGVLIDPEDGVLTRCLAAAYRSMAARSAAGGVEWSVSGSVVELYNEAVTDLLAADKSKQLQVRKDARDGFAVSGLTQAPCPTDTAALRTLVRALQHRHTRAHKLNEYSSRSHCLMTFVFASKEGGGGGGQEGGGGGGGAEGQGQQGAKGGVRRYGKLCLVDLAGSERLKDTGNTERGAVRETGAINKSLFTLGQVLAALSARSSISSSASASASFVPYRDSKLTQLLWDGLRGSGRCLMLACLGPMRASAEESLNTLHFASLATRIKAEPVVLLDPQDQLVLDLRKTISQLRQENATLAGALQQLSLGADPAAVMSGLPEPLRATAAAAAAAQAAQADTATGAAPPPLRAPPQLQPLAGTSGRSLAASSDAGAAAAGPSGRRGDAGGNEGGSSGGGAPPSSSPTAGRRALRLSVSHGSPLRGRLDSLEAGAEGGVGPVPRSAPAPLSDPQNPADPSGPGPAPRVREAWAPQGGVAAGGRGGSRKQLLPTGPSPYGRSSPSPSRAPPASSLDAAPSRHGGRSRGRAASSRASSSPLRARSVGRNGAAGAAAAAPAAGGVGRPAYLTADPGALLYGYSSPSALQPPAAAVSPAAAAAPPPPLRGSSDRSLAPPPPPALAEYPELAAMEAEFQQYLVTGVPPPGGSPSTSGRVGPGGRGAAGWGASGAREAGSSSGGGGARAEAGGGSGDAAGEEDAEPRPDVRALKWAERNTWFGTDYDMTAFAYQVHDQLVGAEGVDPSSDTYYMEIERRVAQRFPERWATLMRPQLPGGSGAAAAAGLRRAAPSGGRLAPLEPLAEAPQPQGGFPGAGSRIPPPPHLRVAPTAPAAPSPLQPPPAQHFGAGLRVSVKDPLHYTAGAGSGTGNGGYPAGGGGGNAASAASLAAQAAAARARQAAGASFPPEDSGPSTPTRVGRAGGAAQFSHSYSHASHASSHASSSATHVSHGSGSTPPLTAGSSGSSEPLTPGGAGQQLNPFNIGALHASAPPKASRFAPAPDRGRGMAVVPGGAELEPDAKVTERIQREYARQRAAVVEELRLAKQEAEMERQRILARIHRAAGGSKWR